MLGLLLQGVMNAKIFMGKDWENFYLGFYMGQVILWRCPAYSTRFSGSETAIITFFTWSLVGWAENATGVSSVSSLFSSIPRDPSPCHSHCRHIPRVWSARTTGNQTWSTPHRKKKKKRMILWVFHQFTLGELFGLTACCCRYQMECRLLNLVYFFFLSVLSLVLRIFTTCPTKKG